MKIQKTMWAPGIFLGLLLVGCGPSASGGDDVDAARGGDGASCESNCDQEGTKSCDESATKVRECRQVAEGCLQWTEDQDCAGQDLVCDESTDPVGCGPAPTCDDNRKNQDETDVDCGGAHCPACGLGQDCDQPEDCESGLCTNGVCTMCAPMSFRCNGNWLEQCAADGQSWTQQQHCEISNSEGCDAEAGACHMLSPIGNGPDNPTGVYYEFARFTVENSALLEGTYPTDVDSFDDLIFVNRDGSHVDVYRVELRDSDGDGELEPNQHPDNPDNPGPIEERVLTYLQTYDVPLGGHDGNELYVTSDSIYFIWGAQHADKIIKTYDRTSHAVTNLVALPTDIPWGSHQFELLGYDDVRDLWFAGTPDRDIFSYDPATGEWSWEFTHPDFAGDHADGMEVVTDPNTGIPYVYVSDMTSDYIAQYHEDENGKWTQVNLFRYNEEHADFVEGMGFGALNHFWIGGNREALYEIGGGDLTQYTEDTDPTHL